jgi:hypothetical protein
LLGGDRLAERMLVPDEPSRLDISGGSIEQFREQRRTHPTTETGLRSWRARLARSSDDGGTRWKGRFSSGRAFVAPVA